MRPQQLEIICYHCQQSAEKILKAVLIQQEKQLVRTHDLGLLIELIAEDITVEDSFFDACDELTHYGASARYPQEISVDEYHVEKAIKSAEAIYHWEIQLLDDSSYDDSAENKSHQ